MTNKDFDFEAWEDRIDDFLNQKMTDTERTQFEADMGQVAGLKEAVDFEKALKQKATEHYLFQHLKPQLEGYIQGNNLEKTPEIEKNVKTGTPKYPLSIGGLLGIVGIIVVSILGIMVYNNTMQKRKVQTEILSRWLIDKPLLFENTNLQDFQTGADAAAIEAYKKGKYAEAEALFKQNDSKALNETGPRGLYRAINALMLTPPDADNALPILQNRYADKNTFRYNAVAWYLALAYLQKNNLGASKKILENVSVDSEYYENVQILLTDLK
jgi:hypothetical protein